MRQTLLCCLTGIFFSRAATAQQIFTWQQIRNQFEKANPTFLSDAVNVNEARAQEITAFLRPNPDVSFGLDQFTVFRTPNTPYRPLAGLLEAGSLSHLHERQRKRDLRLESDPKATKIATASHADLEGNLLFTLRNAFVHALQAKAFFEIGKQNLAYWNEEIEINTDRFNAGDLAKVDLSRIILQRAQYQADYVNSQVNLRNAKIVLLMLLKDRTPVDTFDITGAYEFQESLTRLEDIRQIAMETRPDLKAAVEAVDKSKTDNKLAIANGSSDPTFGFDIGRNPPLPSYLGFSVSFPLRIVDKNQDEKLRTKLDMDRADRSRQAAEAQVLGDVDSAHATVSGVIELLKPYKQEYIPRASEVREIVTFAYQRGGASLIHFLDAQKQYRDTQLNYMNLIGSYLNAAQPTQSSWGT